MSELPSWVGPGPDVHGGDRFDRLRAEARAALEKSGLPGKRVEAFRFTPTRDLAELSFDRASGDADTSSVLRRLGQDETYRVIVGNGAAMLTGSTRDGVKVLALDDALETHGDAVARVLGRAVPNEHFVAANAASFEDAVVVVVPAGVRAEVPVHLVHAISACSKEAVSFPRIVVIAEPGSSLTLVETYLGDSAGRAFVNAVVEIDLAREASLDHVVAAESGGRTISSIGVELADAASYRCRSALLGGTLTRFDHLLSLRGEGASVDLAGVVFARGTEHVDHHVRVEHRGPRGRSTQRFRGLATESGTAIFDGIVVVHVGAPGCEIQQESKNLLLSADATIHAKPHLEIEVDEVVASHGTTVGSFDRDQLFYLRARGLDEAHARALLTHAFVRAVLDDVPVASVRKRLVRQVLGRMPDGESAVDETDDEEVAS